MSANHNGNGHDNGNGHGHDHGNGHGNGQHHGNGAARPRRSLRDWFGGREDELAPYRRLAVQLQCDMPRAGMNRSVLMVTASRSPLGARGSAELSCCLAEELGRPVLLADACPTDAQTSRLLGCAGQAGFAELATDPAASLPNLAVTTSNSGVFFLPAGADAGQRHAATAERLEAIVDAAEKQYDFTVIDGGCALANSAVLSLASRVGCVLLLVIENQTAIEDLEAAQNALYSCQPRRLGLVLVQSSRGRWRGLEADPAGHPHRDSVH